MIKAMYEDTATKVRVNGSEMLSVFSFWVWGHQDSVLSPLLFIIILETLSRKIKEGYGGALCR